MSEMESKKLFEIIGGNIRYYRKLYNLRKGKMTQAQLAELADVSTALIGNLESEHIDQGISVFTLWKISKVLNVPVEKFFDDSSFEDRKIDA